MQRTRFILTVNVLLFALLAFGVYRASERAAFPQELTPYVRAINSTPVSTPSEVEFYVSKYRIDQTVRVTFLYGHTTDARLIAYYDIRYSVIQSFTAFVFAALGFFILLRKRGDTLSRKFNYLTFALATLIAHTTGAFSVPSQSFSIFLETLFHLAYAFSGVLFLQFILTFGQYSGKVRTVIEVSLSFIAGILVIVTSYLFIQALDDVTVFRAYDTALKALRIFFGVLFTSGIAILIHAIRTRRQAALNQQLRWVLYGCTISIFAYILLWQVPLILDSTDIISEETMLLLAVIAPIAIAIGIVRHKLFDIDLLIRRSVSYTLLTVIIIAVYLLTITGATWFAQQLHALDTIYPAAAAAIVAALAFEPLRRKVVAVVDQRFFRTSYDFRKAQKQFLDDITHALDLRALGRIVVERIQLIIPVSRIGFFVLTEDVHRLRLLAHEGFDILDRHGVSFTPEDLKTGLEYPVALPEFVEEAQIEVADRPTFERWKIALVVPMLKGAHRPLGFIVLGKRRSDTRFTSDDVELLTHVATQASIALERLLLQQKLLIEQAESQRLDELNRLKSFFVSSVTHDLKTPLTSIRLYAELLRTSVSEEKKSAYLSTIEGETERLARLITNVLDFARIEQGTKAYAMRSIDLAATVRDAVELLRHYLETEGFALNLQVTDHALMVTADRDAITGVIVNLLSNALKYSSTEKCISVTVMQQKHSAILTIADRGIGMAPEVLNRIFEPFYRVAQNSGSGAGLGLAIVKHTLDAHQASVAVASEPGNGTTFTISFPLV